MPQHPYGRLFLVIPQPHRDALYLEILFKGDVKQLHVKGKSADPCVAENKIRNVPPESLQATLGIKKIGCDDGPDKPGKKDTGKFSELRDLGEIG